MRCEGDRLDQACLCSSILDLLFLVAERRGRRVVGSNRERVDVWEHKMVCRLEKEGVRKKGARKTTQERRELKLTIKRGQTRRKAACHFGGKKRAGLPSRKRRCQCCFALGITPFGGRKSFSRSSGRKEEAVECDG